MPNDYWETIESVCRECFLNKYRRSRVPYKYPSRDIRRKPNLDSGDLSGLLSKIDVDAELF